METSSRPQFKKAIDFVNEFSHIGGMAQKRKQSIKISELKRLCELQCSLEEIASAFYISVDALKKLIEKDPAVKAAIEYGNSSGKISLRRKQFRLASESASMAIHLGKQYLGQTDKSSVEVSGPNGGPIESFDYSKLSPDERAALRQSLETATARRSK